MTYSWSVRVENAETVVYFNKMENLTLLELLFKI